MGISVYKLTLSEIVDAIKVIHSASKANKADYPDEFIDLLNVKHYNEDWLRHMVETKDFFVAKKDGTIVGTVSSSKNQIVNVFVDYQYQGQGIGKLLMVHIEQYLMREGYEVAKLSCNLTSKAFYESLGYELTEQKVEQIQTWEIVSFEMRKSLTT